MPKKLRCLSWAFEHSRTDAQKDRKAFTLPEVVIEEESVHPRSHFSPPRVLQGVDTHVDFSQIFGPD